MRWQMAHIGLCAWLLTGLGSGYAQAQNLDDSSQHSESCPTTTSNSQSSSGPDISIRDVTFSGFIQLPVSEQDQIVASIKQKRYTSAVNGVVDEALERIRVGWQDRGYFKVEVTGNAKTVAESANSFQIALFVNVDENFKYRLGGIRFKNNQAIRNVKALRELFPIKEGDIFSRTKIAEGLENLRKAYGEFGYANYTGVPLTTFDDEKRLAYLQIDVDEGKQFYIAAIKIEGVDEATRQKLSKELVIHPGDIYNRRLIEISLSRMASLFPLCDCREPEKLKFNENQGTIEVTLDFRPCSAN